MKTSYRIKFELIPDGATTIVYATLPDGTKWETVVKTASEEVMMHEIAERLRSAPGVSNVVVEPPKETDRGQ